VITAATLRRPIAWLPAIAAVALVVSACTVVDPSGFGESSTSASASATESVPASEGASSSEEPSSEPTDGLGMFACSFPVNAVGTVARAQITDIRVGTHDGYDRIVFEFDAGVPEFGLDETEPPLLGDASGLPVEVEGNAFWKLVMQGGTILSPDGDITYEGPREFMPGFPKLSELDTGGDFEAVSTWYIGQEEPSCVRVSILTDPSRLVLDIEH
jgi:hypothetical protein